MTGSDLSLKGPSGHLLVNRSVEGKSGCENTSRETSAGNQAREYGNQAWGGEMSIPFKEFHILTALVASLQKRKG